MRQATLTRQPSTAFGTFGDLVTDSGFKCRTLERPAAIADHPCIPAGAYTVKWTVGVHPKHPQVYEVQNVPGRTAILIHSANVYEQLLGCIAPGAVVAMMDLEYEGQDIKHLGVTASKDTLARLIADLKQADFALTIKEAP